MKLSAYFINDELVRDISFSCLGHAKSSVPGTLAYAESIHYLELSNSNPNISGIITSADLLDKVSGDMGVIVCQSPRNAFYLLHEKLIDEKVWQSDTAYGSGKNCVIHPTAVISSKCRIGDNVTINANAVISAGTIIGDNVFIDTAAVIGCEGILYIHEDGNNRMIRHAGHVVLENNVTVLSNASVVRSIHPESPTVVGENSIVGISATIGHDVEIGHNCVVSGNCVIARGAVLENNVHIATTAVLREYIRIGENATVKAGSVVVEDVENNSSVSGNFAINHRKHLLQFAKARR